jgi:hypothetical protein
VLVAAIPPSVPPTATRFLTVFVAVSTRTASPSDETQTSDPAAAIATGAPPTATPAGARAAGHDHGHVAFAALAAVDDGPHCDAVGPDGELQLRGALALPGARPSTEQRSFARFLARMWRTTGESWNLAADTCGGAGR